MSAPKINAVLVVVAAASLSVSKTQICFVRGANTEMKMNGAIAGDSASGQTKFTARQLAALIGYCGVENRKQAQTFESKSKSLVMQQGCAPLWSPQSRNNKLKLTDSPARCGLAMMSRKISENTDSPTDRWQT